MITPPSSFRRFCGQPFILAAAVTLLISGIYYKSPVLWPLDLKGRDFFFKLRHRLSPPIPAAKKIVLVTIDDNSLAKLNLQWPFPRRIYADAIQVITAFSPKVLGFDFIFQGKDRLPANDEALRHAMQAAGNVVIASYLGETGKVVEGMAGYKQAAFRSSLVNKLKDKDGIIRRAPIYFSEAGGKNVGNKTNWSWESEIFFKSEGFSHPVLTRHKNSFVITGEGQRMMIPGRHGAMDINYQASLEQFPTVSFWRVAKGDVRASEFKDKIVLVGLTALAFHDIHQTPLGDLPGLAVNANTILTLLGRDFLFRVPLPVNWLLLYLTLWFILSVTDRYSILKSFLIVSGLSFFYFAGSFFLFYFNVIWDLTVVSTTGIIIFFFAVLYKQFRTAVENIRLREESVRDPLTGFYTRRFLELRLKMDVRRAMAGKVDGRRGAEETNEVSLVMIDLDNFKLVNDTFGHQEGDRVLKILGDTIRSSVRKNELVCRFGGDEFCVILPGASIQHALQFAEKLRTIILNHPDLNYTTRAGVKSFRVTGSLGVASIAGVKAMDPDRLMKAADRALYRAKKGGRNQVCHFDPNQDILDGN